MNKNILYYAVPDKKILRTDIRKFIDNYFAAKEILPPVTYEQLFDYANEIISINNWSKEYLAFAMVCCGNAVWRQIAGSVPFNRRILLLPECLKHSTKCIASRDEFGLMCKECGNCSIAGYINEAEKLGYIVLITEGTTVAQQLIENGSVDAIIGVGCLESLQKIVEPIYKYAVPGIGIPLLSCGCANTLAETEWIFDELNFKTESPEINLLNYNQLKQTVEKIFEPQNLYNILGNPQTETEKIALESLLLGGQRIRPLLAYLTYFALAKNRDNDIINRLVLFTECFHKASLIHDDIEDNDHFRYDKETVHIQHGIPVAINTGDFLIGEGYRLISECNMPAEITGLCFSVIANGNKTLTIGQGEELLAIKHNKILPVNTMINIFEKKTAEAFKVALLSGAIMAQADKNTLEALKNFSVHFGIAYQIKDDLTDFDGVRGDIAFRKFSFLLSLLYEKLSLNEKENLYKLFNDEKQNEITDLIKICDIKNDAAKIIQNHLNQSREWLKKLTDKSLELWLYGLSGKIFKDF